MFGTVHLRDRSDNTPKHGCWLGVASGGGGGGGEGGGGGGGEGQFYEIPEIWRRLKFQPLRLVAPQTDSLLFRTAAGSIRRAENSKKEGSGRYSCLSQNGWV